jgi:hypothetical protein
VTGVIELLGIDHANIIEPVRYPVGVLSRFMSQPRVEHWQVPQQVMRYISGTVDLGILYKGTEQMVVGYCDADYAGDPGKGRSTSGYLFRMAGGAVSWGSSTTYYGSFNL